MIGPTNVARMHPSTFLFSYAGDGSLEAIRLHWRDWGRATSSATGVFVLTTGPRDRVTKRRGQVTVFHRFVCPNPSSPYYYGSVSFRVPDSPFSKRHTQPLNAPARCSDGE